MNTNTTNTFDITNCQMNTNKEKPHDVEIIIKYHDGTHIRAKVDWAIISTMKSLHGESAIDHVYNTAIKESTK